MNINRHAWDLFSLVIWRSIRHCFWFCNVLLIFIVTFFYILVLHLFCHFLCSCISHWHKWDVVMLLSNLWALFSNFQIKFFRSCFLTTWVQLSNSRNWSHNISIWSASTFSTLRSLWSTWIVTPCIWKISIFCIIG